MGGYTDVLSASRAPITAEYYGVIPPFKAGSTAWFNDHTGSGAPCTASTNSACVITTNPASDYYVKTIAPLSAWDFNNVWIEVPGQYPALRYVPLAGGGAGSTVSCVVGAAYDWDNNGEDDGCRGTNVVIDPSVTIPAGSQLGNDVEVLAGAQIGTGNILHNGVIIGSRAQLGNNTTLLGGVVVARRAEIGDGVSLGVDSVVGRSVRIGSGSSVTGVLSYGSEVGANVDASDLTLGSLAVLGSATGSVNCPGPLVIARSSQVAAGPSMSFTCTGSVIIGPDTTVEAGAFGANIRLRKSGFLGDLVTLGDNVRVSRSVQLEGGVTLSTGARVGAQSHLCDTSTPYSGVIPRATIDPACP